MISKEIRSTGYADEEEPNHMHETVFTELFHKQFLFTKDEDFTLLPLPQKPCDGHIPKPNR